MSRDDNIQGIFCAIGPFWPKWGLGGVPRSASFFCLVNHATFWQLRNGRFSPNLATKRISVSRRRIRKDIFKNFHFRGHLPQKLEIENRSNRHLTQSRLQVTECTAERYCLVCTVVQGPGSFRYRYVDNFSLRHKVAQFSDFGLFSPYKTPKTYLPVTSLQPRCYITEWFRFFPCGSRRSKGVASGTGVFLQLLVGELGTPKLAQIFAYRWQMPISIQNETARRVRSGPKMSENAQFQGRMYFPTKYLRPYPKTQFWDLSMQNLLHR